MIPRTFPSTYASNGQQQMVVYSLPSVTGLTAWIDYIPVKGVTTESATLENTYANGGYQVVNSLSSLTGKQAWLDYIPVYEDPSYTKPWSTDAGGYIPTSALAALLLDFTSGRLDPRITFSRTTNATVTGSNGLIQYAPHNLLTFSEQFDNAAWNKANTTVTANSTVAPDGTTTADTVVTSPGGFVSNVQQLTTKTTGVTYTFSVFVKRGSVKRVLVGQQFGSGSFTDNIFDLETTTWVLQGAGTTLSFVDFGNGWLRLSVGVTATSTGSFLSFAGPINDNGTAFNSTTTGNTVFLWGAQLELGSTATTYNPTTVKNLLGFTEHFDNAAWTKSNSFVQTNQLLQSQDFDNVYWSKTASTVTANTTTAPDGSITADSLIEAATTDFHSTFRGSLTLNAAAYTFSCFAKPNGRNEITLVLLSGADSATAAFNVNTGAIAIAAATSGTFSSGSASITAAANGFYRVTLTATAPATGAATAAIELYNGARSYAGNGTSGIFIWGAQLVQGTSAGDYKATYAAAAAVGYTDIYGQPFAQKLVATADNSQHIVVIPATTSAAPFTANIYAKAAEQNFLFIRMNNVNNTLRRCWFNLATGVVGTVNADLTAAITDVGNGWYRCSVTVNSALAGAQNIGFGLSDADNVFTYTGDGTSGIYIFGAQLSDSASVDPYVYQPVAAPASTAYYGPRFDYDPVTLAPKGLLIEEQRVNLLLRSEEFDAASWTKIATTVTANAAVSPDGTADADRLTETATSGEHYTSQQIAKAASNITYTHSVYFKNGAGTRNFAISITDGTTGGYGAIFSTSGSVVSASFAIGSVVGWTAVASSVVPVGNGWYRAFLTVTSNTATRLDAVCYLVSGTTTAYAGDGTSNILIYGAQLEAGAFPTSYIPTVASQVTRAADNASIIGNNFARWYTQGVGTLFAEGATIGDSITAMFQVDDGTSANRVVAVVGQPGPSSIPALIVVSGAFQTAFSNVTSVDNNKVAIAYKTNDIATTFNGGSAQTDTSAIIPVVNQARIKSNATGAANGTVKRISYFNRRLANTELVALTS
jgi:hypothetical protein